MNAGLEAIISAMSEGERAALAAEVLNAVSPSPEHLGTFFNALSDDLHDEVALSAAERPLRD
jgi:hypothetical protein